MRLRVVDVSLKIIHAVRKRKHFHSDIPKYCIKGSLAQQIIFMRSLFVICASLLNHVLAQIKSINLKLEATHSSLRRMKGNLDLMHNYKPIHES